MNTLRSPDGRARERQQTKKRKEKKGRMRKKILSEKDILKSRYKYIKGKKKILENRRN